MKNIVFALSILFATAASVYAEETDDAFKFCQFIDRAQSTTSPCKISNTDLAVTIVLDLTVVEGRFFCQGTYNFLQQHDIPFPKGWTLNIKSPYSSKSNIAYCIPNPSETDIALE